MIWNRRNESEMWDIDRILISITGNDLKVNENGKKILTLES
jgi:hypothetical protein